MIRKFVWWMFFETNLPGLTWIMSTKLAPWIFGLAIGRWPYEVKDDER